MNPAVHCGDEHQIYSLCNGLRSIEDLNTELFTQLLCEFLDA